MDKPVSQTELDLIKDLTSKFKNITQSLRKINGESDSVSHKEKPISKSLEKVTLETKLKPVINEEKPSSTPLDEAAFEDAKEPAELKHKNLFHRAWDFFSGGGNENIENISSGPKEQPVSQPSEGVPSQVKVEPVESKEKNTEPVFYGISFDAQGFSIAVRLLGQNPRLIKVSSGDNPYVLPATVLFPEKGDSILVGVDPEHISKLPKGKFKNVFNLSSSNLNESGPDVQWRGHSYSGREIIAIVLKHLKYLADQKLNLPSEANRLEFTVISCPAFWLYSSRFMLKSAAHIAGFHRAHIINKRLASALYWFYETKRKPHASFCVVICSDSNHFDVAKFQRTKTESFGNINQIIATTAVNGQCETGEYDGRAVQIFKRQNKTFLEHNKTFLVMENELSKKIFQDIKDSHPSSKFSELKINLGELALGTVLFEFIRQQSISQSLRFRFSEGRFELESRNADTKLEQYLLVSGRDVFSRFLFGVVSYEKDGAPIKEELPENAQKPIFIAKRYEREPLKPRSLELLNGENLYDKIVFSVFESSLFVSEKNLLNDFETLGLEELNNSNFYHKIGELVIEIPENVAMSEASLKIMPTVSSVSAYLHSSGSRSNQLVLTAPSLLSLEELASKTVFNSQLKVSSFELQNEADAKTSISTESQQLFTKTSDYAKTVVSEEVDTVEKSNLVADDDLIAIDTPSSTISTAGMSEIDDQIKELEDDINRRTESIHAKQLKYDESSVKIAELNDERVRLTKLAEEKMMEDHEKS
jgi:hypothetical protein